MSGCRLWSFTRDDALPLRIALLGLMLVAASSCSAPSSGGVSPASTAARGSRLPDSLLAPRTLEEKIGQLTVAPAEWDQTGPQAPAGGDERLRIASVPASRQPSGSPFGRRPLTLRSDDAAGGGAGRLHRLRGWELGWRPARPVPGRRRHPGPGAASAEASGSDYPAGSRPFSCSGRNGPGSAISARAASTWFQVFHRSTPRTRPFWR
jgi:hypothetical protein